MNEEEAQAKTEAIRYPPPPPPEPLYKQQSDGRWRLKSGETFETEAEVIEAMGELADGEVAQIKVDVMKQYAERGVTDPNLNVCIINPNRAIDMTCRLCSLPFTVLVGHKISCPYCRSRKVA